MADEVLDLTAEHSAARTRRTLHPWFAVRSAPVAEAVVRLALDRIGDAAREQPAAAELPPRRLLDLFSGTGSIAGAAVEQDCEVDAVELNPVGHLIAEALWSYPVHYGAADGEWRGLMQEFQTAAAAVWGAVEAAVAGLYPDQESYALWVRVVACPTCGHRVDSIDAGRVAHSLPGEPDRQRAMACRHCGVALRLDEGQIRQADLRLAALLDRRGEVVAVDDPVGMVPAAQVPAHVWAIDHMIGTPRQALVVLTAAEAVRQLRRDLQARGLQDVQRRALLDCLALQVSAVSSLARGEGTFMRRFHSGGRPGRRWPRAFVEPSLDRWRSTWSARAETVSFHLEEGAKRTASPRLHLGDAGVLPFEDDRFDAVVCDPPYFDNLEYSTESAPHYRWLRTMGAGSGFRDPEPPQQGEVVLRSGGDREASLATYDALLRRAMSEAARVLRPGGCLAVLCSVRDPEKLDEFLRMVSPEGLELLELVPIRTETLIAQLDGGPSTYLVLLRRTLATPGDLPPTADARRVFELVDQGRQHLFGAVAEMLSEEWEDEDLARIPDNYRGDRSQRIAEYAAGYADPGELLASLGPRALRRQATRLGIAADQRPAEPADLATMLLRHIGFTVPAAAPFTFVRQLATLRSAEQTLAMVTDVEQLHGRYKTGASAVERALMVATKVWLQAAYDGPADEVLEQLFLSVRNRKGYYGPDAFSFGDWKDIFLKLPTGLTESAPVELRPALGKLAKAIKRFKVTQRLDTHVGRRNMIDHADPDYEALSFPERVQWLHQGLSDGVKALEALIDSGGLPQVLQPVEERRDAWGRRTLAVLDERSIRREFYVDRETDLTEPLFWFPTGSNPREVMPHFLDFASVDVR